MYTSKRSKNHKICFYLWELFKDWQNKTIHSKEFENTFWYFDNFNDQLPITNYLLHNKFWCPLKFIWIKSICVTCQQIFNDFKNLILRIIQKMYLLHCTVQLALMRRLIKKKGLANWFTLKWVKKEGWWLRNKTRWGQHFFKVAFEFWFYEILKL